MMTMAAWVVCFAVNETSLNSWVDLLVSRKVILYLSIQMTMTEVETTAMTQTMILCHIIISGAFLIFK
jgi:hypothetical protein